MMTFRDEVKIIIVEMQNGFCKFDGCLNEIHSIHHKLHNTKANRNLFPLFIHSIFNATGLCGHHHANAQHLFRITEIEAKYYEECLMGLTKKL